MQALRSADASKSTSWERKWSPWFSSLGHRDRMYDSLYTNPDDQRPKNSSGADEWISGIWPWNVLWRTSSQRKCANSCSHSIPPENELLRKFKHRRWVLFLTAVGTVVLKRFPSNRRTCNCVSVDTSIVFNWLWWRYFVYNFLDHPSYKCFKYVW